MTEIDHSLRRLGTDHVDLYQIHRSIELLQKGAALAPAEPWKSMPNSGTW